MNVYVYKTGWECFWSPQRHVIASYASIWSVECNSSTNDFIYKLILSTKPIEVELARGEYYRPSLKLLGVFDSIKHPRWERERDNIVTSFRIMMGEETEIKLNKMRTAKKESVPNMKLYIPDTEEASIILELFEKKRFDEFDVIKESIKEIEETL